MRRVKSGMMIRQGGQRWGCDMNIAEKIASYGAESISTRDLLKRLLGVSDIAASKLMELLGDDLERIDIVNDRLIQKIPDVGPATIAKLRAAFALVRRSEGKKVEKSNPVVSSRIAYAMLRPKLAGLQHEEFWVMFLRHDGTLISMDRVSRGTIGKCAVYTREIFKLSISLGAKYLILAHNHPSGDPNPSREDRQLTRRVVQASKLIDVEVFDHLVIGCGGYVSFVDQGIPLGD